MSSNDVLSGLSLLIVAYGGVIVLAVLLPFVAAFLLDGVVQILRNNGLRFFLLAVGMTVVVAGVGYFLYKCGISSPWMTSATLSSVNMVAGILLTFSTPLALMTFLIRTGKLLLKKRAA